VYAFTPKGDVVDLPVGSTAIDFAYHIHTEIGHRCRGARIQGRVVNLSYQLQTGDQVEIITSKRGGPSLDWLNPNLGYVKTARARDKIRAWFRKQNREKHVILGRELLERELKRLGLLNSMSFDAVAVLFSFEKPEDFLVAVGAGDINSAQITNRILEIEHKRQQERAAEERLLRPKLNPASMPGSNGAAIDIMGSSGMLVSLARCCHPMPGDPIIGYITRGRGVSVHRLDCANVIGHLEQERIVDVTWGHAEESQRYSVPIEIIAYDREGLMRDIGTLIADEQVNITAMNVTTRQDIATLQLTIELRSATQLARILTRLEYVTNVVEVRRRHMS
jgi:GTP pyrophosphokinase